MVPPTVQVSPPPFFAQISPDDSQSFPSFIYVGSYFMAFVYSIPIVIYDQEKHCIQVMIQSIISAEMLTTVGEHRDLLYHMMENKQKKGGFQVTREKHSSCNLDSWMRRKNILSPIIPLPEWALILKKIISGDRIYSIC